MNTTMVIIVVSAVLLSGWLFVSFTWGWPGINFNRKTECVDSLRKAIALNPKAAQAEKAKRVLASLLSH